ncbi:hypothetical protein [Pseudomonas sp. LB3P14]
MNGEDLNKLEAEQFHGFVLFSEGNPKVTLGWSTHSKLVEAINSTLTFFKEELNTDVYFHEHEYLIYENFFIWWFSFIERDSVVKKRVASELERKVNDILRAFPDTANKQIVRTDHPEFHPDPDFMMHYLSIVEGADLELKSREAPKNKSYEKEPIDMSLFERPMSVVAFKATIRNYFQNSTEENLSYLAAEDGFFSTRRPENKFLREELLPIFYYVQKIKAADDEILSFGLKADIFDLKVSQADGLIKVILEITWALPEDDHKLLSLVSQVGSGFLPVKTRADFKKMSDSLGEKIVSAINRKHKKQYPDQRSLLVVVPQDYTYQGDESLMQEIILQVQQSLVSGKGKFEKIYLLCGNRFYTLY